MSSAPDAGRERTRATALSRWWLLVLLGLLGARAWRRRPTAQTTPPEPTDDSRPVHVPLAADLQPHDGISGTRLQLVFLEGGPMHGSRVALPWDAQEHLVRDEDHREHRYLDSGQTRPDALGQAARVFVER